MLTIDRLHAAYHVPHGTPDPLALQGRLDRMARERLPGAIELPGGVAEGAGAYYVIRRLHVNLWVDALAMDDGEVAERWGKVVAGAVTRAILYGGDGVRRYEDAGEYLAAFLDDLMAGIAWSRWEYEQLRPLEGLSPGAAAANLLASRPALLVQVAERLARAGSLLRLLESLSEADAALVWRDGLGFTDAALPGLPDGLEASLEGVEVWMPAGSTGAAFRRYRLAAYVHLSISMRRYEPDAAIAVVAHGLARLQELMVARPAPAVWQALEDGEIESLAALAGFLGGLDAVAPARDWLVEAMSAPGGPAKVAALVRALRPASPAVETSAGTGLRARTVASAFAGLAVLVPVIRELSLFEQSGRDAVYQLLPDATGPEHSALAALDAGVRLVAGVEPTDAERARRADVSWAHPESSNADEQAGPPGYLPVTLQVLRRFASRLRGFEASSPDYVGRQFLRLPGHMELTKGGLTVTLHEAPLGLVLQMNGLTGPQGRVPWLDGRELVIQLAGGMG